MAKGYDYSEDRYGLTLHFPNGKTTFLQGDDASELQDQLEACETQEQIDMIISEYEVLVEE